MEFEYRYKKICYITSQEKKSLHEYNAGIGYCNARGLEILPKAISK